MIDYSIQFPLDVKTQGCLLVNISDAFSPEKVFIGNASETRFLTNSSLAQFTSYQLTPQEYLRQHWLDPNSKHGHDYGIEFDSIPEKVDGNHVNYKLTGSYKTFQENRVNEIIYIKMKIHSQNGRSITPGNYVLLFAEFENLRNPGGDKESFYCGISFPRNTDIVQPASAVNMATFEGQNVRLYDLDGNPSTWLTEDRTSPSFWTFDAAHPKTYNSHFDNETGQFS